MLRSFKVLRGFAIRATDARIGTVGDVYFDDRSWRVRYCVVDSDGWFAGRSVQQQASGVMTSIRRLEKWTSTDHPNPTGLPTDAHLRSCRAVIGHRVEAIDGTIGSVADLLIDDKGWIVRELIVATDRRRRSATHVRIPAPQVRTISWPNSSVAVDLRREEVLAAPSYQPMSNEATLPSLPM